MTLTVLLAASLALKDIFAPVVVGTPPRDAVRSLCVTAQGEIRHYGGPHEVNTTYLSSMDNGISWQMHDAERGDVGPMVRSPWSGEWIYFTYSLGAQGLVRSKTGPGDTHATRTVLPWRRLELRQLLALRARKRWIAAFSNIACENDNGYLATVAYSDDDGLTWTRKDIEPVPNVPRLSAGDKRPHWYNTGCEPTIVELRNGELLMAVRTSGPHVAFYRSKDGGESWSRGAVDTAFWQSNTMPCLHRLPDGRILFIWNNTASLPTRDASESPELSAAELKGRWESVFTNRDALHAAISDDDGLTWRGFREIALNEVRNAPDFRELADGKDQSVHQSQVMDLPGGKVLVAYGQGRSSRRLAVFDPNWLLETQRRTDFRKGLGDVSVQLYVRSLSGGARGWAGHCAWNRTAGAMMVRDPDTDDPPPGTRRSIREVLQLCRICDPRLVSDRQGIVWNFPASRKGRVTLDCRIVGSGFRLTLADHWINPCDEVGPALSPLSIRMDRDELRGRKWHRLTVEWDCENAKAVIAIGTAKIAEMPLAACPRFGLSYLHLQTLAEDMDPKGTYFRCFEKEDL